MNESGALRGHQALGGGAEFSVIRRLVDRWGPLAADIGDDAAVLPPPPPGTVRVISTDACVEGVHFRPGWLTPGELGARAVTAALSDLAAMGARPEFLLLAFTLPAAWEPAMLAVADGVAVPVAEAGACIVGGNITRGAQWALVTTVLGAARRPVPRGGARPGDLLVVTGVLGGPGEALRALLADEVPKPWARQRFAGPVARWREGVLLAEGGASAMIDVSDGLAADAAHLASASGVALVLDPARLPVGPGIAPQAALASGEEYELLAAIPPDCLPALHAAWGGNPWLAPVTVIGRVEAGTGVRVDHGGVPAGFDHLRGGQTPP